MKFVSSIFAAFAVGALAVSTRNPGGSVECTDLGSSFCGQGQVLVGYTPKYYCCPPGASCGSVPACDRRDCCSGAAKPIGITAIHCSEAGLSCKIRNNLCCRSGESCGRETCSEKVCCNEPTPPKPEPTPPKPTPLDDEISCAEKHRITADYCYPDGEKKQGLIRAWRFCCDTGDDCGDNSERCSRDYCCKKEAVECKECRKVCESGEFYVDADGCPTGCVCKEPTETETETETETTSTTSTTTMTTTTTTTDPTPTTNGTTTTTTDPTPTTNGTTTTTTDPTPTTTDITSTTVTPPTTFEPVLRCNGTVNFCVGNKVQSNNDEECCEELGTCGGDYPVCKQKCCRRPDVPITCLEMDQTNDICYDEGRVPNLVMDECCNDGEDCGSIRTCDSQICCLGSINPFTNCASYSCNDNQKLKENSYAIDCCDNDYKCGRFPVGDSYYPVCETEGLCCEPADARGTCEDFAESITCTRNQKFLPTEQCCEFEEACGKDSDGNFYPKCKEDVCCGKKDETIKCAAYDVAEGVCLANGTSPNSEKDCCEKSEQCGKVDGNYVPVCDESVCCKVNLDILKCENKHPICRGNLKITFCCKDEGGCGDLIPKCSRQSCCPDFVNDDLGLDNTPSDCSSKEDACTDDRRTTNATVPCCKEGANRCGKDGSDEFYPACDESLCCSDVQTAKCDDYWKSSPENNKPTCTSKEKPRFTWNRTCCLAGDTCDTDLPACDLNRCCARPLSK